MYFGEHFFFLRIGLSHLLHEAGILHILCYCHLAEVLELVDLWLCLASVFSDDPAALDEAMKIALLLADTCSQLSPPRLYIELSLASLTGRLWRQLANLRSLFLGHSQLGDAFSAWSFDGETRIVVYNFSRIL